MDNITIYINHEYINGRSKYLNFNLKKIIERVIQRAYMLKTFFLAETEEQIKNSRKRIKVILTTDDSAKTNVLSLKTEEIKSVLQDEDSLNWYNSVSEDVNNDIDELATALNEVCFPNFEEFIEYLRFQLDNFSFICGSVWQAKIDDLVTKQDLQQKNLPKKTRTRTPIYDYEAIYKGYLEARITYPQLAASKSALHKKLQLRNDLPYLLPEYPQFCRIIKKKEQEATPPFQK